MLGILDYGVGNLQNLKNAFDYQGLPCRIVAEAAEVRACERLVLPGVGAFCAAVERLRALELESCVKERVAEGMPLLGVCVGMQLLFDSSTEGQGGRGLGCVAGEVVRFAAPGYKVPLVGWAPVRLLAEDPLLAGLPDQSWFYFVHSYHACPQRPESLLGVSDYGGEFAAIVRQGNVWGLQFHPEKSQHCGLQLLHNFFHLAC